jgi:hypothetical protein
MFLAPVHRPSRVLQRTSRITVSIVVHFNPPDDGDIVPFHQIPAMS